MPQKMKDIYILGISAFYHDSAACLVKNGKILAAVQEERFTRKKHDHSFPKLSIEYCLQFAGITVNDLSFIGFYDKPFLKFERLLLTYLSFAPIGVKSFLKSMPLWLNQKLFLKDVIRKELDYKGEIIFTEHHESHAASAFYPSPFSESAILTMDGVGEWATTSYGIGKNNDINILADIQFPHSVGLLYSAFTYYTGFRVNSGEYKLMGLAPYGEPKYVDLIKRELVDLKEDGSFRLNMKYFNYCVGLTMTNKRFHSLFGFPPRKPETKIFQIYMDVARSIQEVTEEIVFKMVNHVHAVTKKKDLCLAGGVALNCVSNGNILRKSKFSHIWIQPAAGDAGGALGVALFIWHRYLNNPRDVNNKDDSQKGSYLGPEYNSADIETFLHHKGISYEAVAKEDLPNRIAMLIDSQKVIGLFNGRMEFGPRALGARSIIGDARSDQMQSIINLKIKFRESFRPFAASVLEEKVADYFNIRVPSAYMLLVDNVKEDQICKENRNLTVKGLDKLKIKRSQIPAITHVDYSARIQTVSQKNNPFFYNIIKAFCNLTGCPVIVNTSFNVRGEPIVCSLEDAYECFMRTGMDYLVLGNFIINKKEQPGKNIYKKEETSLILD